MQWEYRGKRWNGVKIQVIRVPTKNTEAAVDTGLTLDIVQLKLIREFLVE